MADNNDSIAPSIAMVKAEGKSVVINSMLMVGASGLGRLALMEKRSPMVSIPEMPPSSRSR
ncbi:MAG: hypothetical protein BWY72_01104 [Bacteroidetes bacterium ADurb.Bin416]|nr:MAG: hypothetical protein BWY72_01104 [Bacteroidetes bacterium ADurb.Bin416]